MKRDIEKISQFLEKEIVPRYDAFDAGHRRDHVHHVMATSQQLAQFYPEVDRAMLLVAAAYHDLGLANGRERHHIDSAKILHADQRLRQWFTEQEIDTMADAAEDHRASLGHAPRTIYGRIVAESDRQIVPEVVVRRTMQYTRAHMPGLDKDEEFQRLQEHIHEKYAEGGYLHLWIPESDNARQLQRLRAIIDRPEQLRALFDRLYPEI